MSEQGRGAISDRHPLGFTTLEGRVLAPQADVMLVVGSRFVSNSGPEPAWSAPGQKYIYVNIDENGAAWPRPPGASSWSGRRTAPLWSSWPRDLSQSHFLLWGLSRSASCCAGAWRAR